MSPTNEEVIEMYQVMNIVSWVTTFPVLVLWIWEFVRIMRQKDRAKFFTLTVICFLMIVSLIASIVQGQVAYTCTKGFLNGSLNGDSPQYQILEASMFTAMTTFNLAHWFFAFSYFVLSYQIELLLNNQPEDT